MKQIDLASVVTEAGNTPPRPSWIEDVSVAIGGILLWQMGARHAMNSLPPGSDQCMQL